MAYRTAKRDGNHSEIVKKLRDAGATVLDLAAVGKGAPDLLVGFRGANYLIEIKDPLQPKNKTNLRENQVEFHQGWKGKPPAVAMTAREALVIIGAITHKGRWAAGIDGGDV